MCGGGIASNLRSVLARLDACKLVATPRLVAVSKTKSVEDICEAYDAGQRFFGENYVQELHSKANDERIKSKCPEISWHFIGHCQSNKVSKVVDCPNLFMFETLSSAKLAEKLQQQCAKSKIEGLRVMVQVNTSGEENKGGVEVSEVENLVDFVVKKCPNLKFVGLMTIGAFANSSKDEGDNPDFSALIDCRKGVAKMLGVAATDLELSMGMSHDFETAVRMGSTSVRVGKTIFGAREPKKDDKIDAQQMAELKIDTWK